MRCHGLMTGAEQTRGEGVVDGAHRVIRAISGEEGPHAGALVTYGDSVAVLIDESALSAWTGWTHAGDEHVMGPVDVIRREHGHGVLLPWCTQRLATFLGRRSAAEVPLSGGEKVTVVISMLRGIGELGRASHEAEGGTWWITDGGRPVFVFGTGDGAAAEAARLIGRWDSDDGDRALCRVLTMIGEGLRSDPLRPGVPPRQLDAWEEELLHLAAPRPLRLDVHPQERARDIAVVRDLREGAASPALPRDRSGRRLTGRARGRVAWASVTFRRMVESARGAHRDEEHRGARRRRTESRALTGVRRRRHPDRARENTQDERSVARRAPRRRLVVVAGLATTAVLAVGLLWPTGDATEPSSASDREGSAQKRSGGSRPGGDEGAAAASTEDATIVAEPSPSSSPSSDITGDDDDPLVAAPALLHRIAECLDADDAVCSAAVADGAKGVIERFDAAPAMVVDPVLTLVDEYGDVAVVRVARADGADDDAAKTADLIVVLVRLAEKWLVRDVYDVADQPG